MNSSTKRASAAFLASLRETAEQTAVEATRLQETKQEGTVHHITINRPTRCTIVLGQQPAQRQRRKRG